MRQSHRLLEVSVVSFSSFSSINHLYDQKYTFEIQNYVRQKKLQNLILKIKHIISQKFLSEIQLF